MQYNIVCLFTGLQLRKPLVHFCSSHLVAIATMPINRDAAEFVVSGVIAVKRLPRPAQQRRQQQRPPHPPTKHPSHVALFLISRENSAAPLHAATTVVSPDLAIWLPDPPDVGTIAHSPRVLTCIRVEF